jgi:DNA-binding LacI/PurR family transcriptional regulator
VAEAVAAAVGELERFGYTALVHFGQPGAGHSVARTCERVQPVGLVAPADELPPERVAALRRNGTRAILAFSSRPLNHVATLTFDQASVGRIALEHLAARGHERVLALMPAGELLADVATGRLAGARAASRARGVRLAVLRCAFDPEAIRAALARRPAATALYAFNDEMALAAIAALADLGRSVPADVAVIGCDDSPAARLLRPRLTTMRLTTPDRWRSVARVVHQMVEGGEPRSIVDAPELVAGATS